MVEFDGFSKMLSLFYFLYIFFGAAVLADKEKSLFEFIRAFDAPVAVRIEIEK